MVTYSGSHVWKKEEPISGITPCLTSFLRKYYFNMSSQLRFLIRLLTNTDTIILTNFPLALCRPMQAGIPFPIKLPPLSNLRFSLRLFS
jgi:hypothetical protein